MIISADMGRAIGFNALATAGQQNPTVLIRQTGFSRMTRGN